MQMLNFVNLNISWNKKRFSHLKAVILVKKKRNIDFTRKEKQYNKKHRKQKKDGNSLTYHIQYNEIDIIDNRYRNKLKWCDRISDIVSWYCELQDNVEQCITVIGYIRI